MLMSCVRQFEKSTCTLTHSTFECFVFERFDALTTCCRFLNRDSVVHFEIFYAIAHARTHTHTCALRRVGVRPRP